MALAVQRAMRRAGRKRSSRTSNARSPRATLRAKARRKRISSGVSRALSRFERCSASRCASIADTRAHFANCRLEQDSKLFAIDWTKEPLAHIAAENEEYATLRQVRAAQCPNQQSPKLRCLTTRSQRAQQQEEMVRQREQARLREFEAKSAGVKTSQRFAGGCYLAFRSNSYRVAEQGKTSLGAMFRVSCARTE